jgi:hypothetical protein
MAREGDKKFSDWRLPEGYHLREVQEEVPDDFMASLLDEPSPTHLESRYSVVDRDGNVVTHCGMSTADDSQAALRSAYWALAVRTVDRCGWTKIRDLTDRETEVYKYLSKRGYFANTGVRM